MRGALKGGVLAATMLALFGAAAAQRQPARSAAQVPAEARRALEAELRGRSVVTPIEIAFESPADFDRFASGEAPLDLVLRSTVSGQTIRIPSRALLEGFRPGRDRRTVTVQLVIGDLLAPLWDSAGCVEARAAGTDAAGAGPALLTLTYAPCGGAPAALTAGSPIPGIIVKGGVNPGTRRGSPIGGLIVKGGRNPPANLRIGIGPSAVGAETEQSLRARFAGEGAANVIVIGSYKGSGTPKNAGF